MLNNKVYNQWRRGASYVWAKGLKPQILAKPPNVTKYLYEVVKFTIESILGLRLHF